MTWSQHTAQMASALARLAELHMYKIGSTWSRSMYKFATVQHLGA